MARKIHGRSIRYKPERKGRKRKTRPKSFKTEESAKKWAASKGIKEFTVKNLKNKEAKQKKLVVVPKA